MLTRDEGRMYDRLPTPCEDSPLASYSLLDQRWAMEDGRTNGCLSKPGNYE